MGIVSLDYFTGSVLWRSNEIKLPIVVGHPKILSVHAVRCYDMQEDPDYHMNLTAEATAALIRWEALKKVLRERDRQNRLWEEQNHDDYRWLAILSEEVGEVSQAILHDEFGGKATGGVEMELVQVAAVALQWLECIERRNNETKE